MLIKKFEEQAKKTPDRIAIKTGKLSFSYEELNDYANRVAGLIEKNWPKHESKYEHDPLRPGNIALFLEHGVDMIAAILGTLKAGKAYVPISTGYPQKRVSYMVKHSEASLLIANSRSEEKAGEIAWGNNIALVNIDENNKSPVMFAGDMDRKITGERLAYIMYTSGSTGKPKGVMQNHGNVIYYIKNWTRRFSITHLDRMTLFSSFCHDGSVQDMFGALLNGATLYPFDVRNQGTNISLSRFLIEEKITIWHSVPSLYNFFVTTLTGEERFEDLRYILLGGEPFRGYEIDMFKKYFPRSILANVYGQTESSVDSIWTIGAKDPIKRFIIGEPLDNTRIFVIDNGGNEMEPFKTGEIMIACPHITPGYWQDGEATKKTFGENQGIGRWYRTGDLGRLLPDGNIEFMGRKDLQVKIRGFRVEIGEIETVLLQMENVREAAVVPRKTVSTDTYLCAFIVAAKELNVTELREFLSGELPDYMIPTSFVQLEQMPLTQSGKIDRKALAELDKEPLKLNETFTAPKTGIEKITADTWKEVLNLEEVGINDNFFDLGGNSFDIIKVNNKLNQRLERSIPIVKLFEYPTIGKLSRYLSGRESTRGLQNEQSPLIPPAPKPGQTGLEIAVIGMAGRFPGARNIDEFWENIKNGTESISYFSDEELEEVGVDPDRLKNPDYVKAKGLLEDIEYFDASFFNITPKEAELMDPQLRFFLECTWEALEHAGYDSSQYDGLIGLYAGNVPNHHWIARTYLHRSNSLLGPFETGLLVNHFSTRVSYNLNLRGPVVSVQTACSTSLVAIHMACRGLVGDECYMAAAGGVSISLPKKSGYYYREGLIFSSNGHVRAFDTSAKGTVFGDGVGCIVLKRLEHALLDGDFIHAVIKGSAINNDGIRKVGYTAPSIEGQMEVISAAQQAAAVEPESIGFIETHGTGTMLGDPIEIEALKRLFNKNRKGSCAIGALKNNVGHLNAAAGAAGFIKTVLSLKHRLIPPTINFEIPNPLIDFINSPFYINTTLTEWENGAYPLRAGVSSFGFGGTNAHVILEEWLGRASPAVRPVQGAGEVKAREYQLILSSAKTQTALDRMKENLANYLRENPDINLADFAYTLLVGRKAFRHRWMTVCSTVDEAIEELTSPGRGEAHVISLEEESSGFQDTEPVANRDKQYLTQIGQLSIRGHKINWEEFYSREKRYRVPLPTYPFERQRYWIEVNPFKMDESLFFKRAPEKNQDTTPKVSQAHQQFKASSPPKVEMLYHRPELNSVYIAPRNEKEEKLADIWQQFFGFAPIGINDDFFELGGDSLTVITIVSRIQKELNVMVPITEFFNKPTVEGTAEYISGCTPGNTYISVESMEEKEFYPLSPAQKRIYISHQIKKESKSYNIPVILEIRGKIDTERLENTFKLLITRHESLRTSFMMLKEEPVQVVHDEVEFRIEYFESREKETREILKTFIRPFSLEKAPLLRVGLCDTGGEKCLLMVDMYHIISDGFSYGILVKDFLALWEKKQLPPIKIRYKDFAQWQ
ncbi:MAG: amino acid adenylation domain-containing protein, partial [Candidatus Aminicenantes bacterium]